jgi:hypothetical protein
MWGGHVTQRRIVDALELMVRKTAVVTELADSKVRFIPRHIPCSSV